MSLVTVVSPVNAYVFTEYILPRLQQFVSGQGSKAKPLARATYAGCLASLALTSSRILDMVQALRADGSIPTVDPEAENGANTVTVYQNLFDVAKYELLEHFEAHTKALLTDKNASVRQAFLGSVSSLCVFFGNSKANDVILSHLNTYLNDKDWKLKCAFFHTIVGVAAFVGGTSVEEFILPLMIQALTDSEDFVVVKVLSSFASMAELGLFQRSKIWEMVDVVSRFVMHPNFWIREAATHFVTSATWYLSEADIHCIILPLLQPYLKTPLTSYSETNILDALKKPLSRQVLEMAATWAVNAKGGLYWKSIQQQKSFSFGFPRQTVPTISSKDLQSNALSKILKNEEDDQWLTRLRNIGMTAEDEFKLLALREYIWRMASKRSREGIAVTPSPLNNIVNLKEMNVTPQTVFFEVNKRKSSTGRPVSHRDQEARTGENAAKGVSRTIADALLDASTAIDDPLASLGDSHFDQKDLINGNLLAQPLPTDMRRDTSSLNSPLSTSPIRRSKSQNSPSLNTDAEVKRPQRLHSNIIGHKSGKDETRTSASSLKAVGGSERVNGLSHKASAINLLNKKDTSKTSAETITTSANAFGMVDGPFLHDSSHDQIFPKQSRGSQTRDTSQTRAGHTYDGNDPSVLKLLDSLASENHPADIIDFGPLVTPTSRQHIMKKTDTSETDKPWRPDRTLVATFGEHKGPINRVMPSPDHVFFITASDDGTVKVWDTLRLERNLAHRSRQTHKHADGAKVKCITFVENTHSFISCATDGSVHVVKVDYLQIGDTSRYGKLRLVREYYLPGNQYAVWVEHFKFETSSILLLATNTSQIVAIDLRNMAVLYSFENPVHHGTPTCFCVDKKHSWLLLGTSHGVLDLWDLRFRLRLKGWGLAGGTPIYRLQVHPFKGRGRWVCITGGTGQTDITVWDLEKTECREVYRAGLPRNSSKDNLKIYDPWKVDDEKPEGMLSRFAKEIEPAGTGNGIVDRGIRALAVGLDVPEDGREAKYGFFLTGGSEKKLRFWDVMRVEASMVISGLDFDEEQPKYTSTHPTATLLLNSERAPQPGPSAPNAAAGQKSSPNNAAKKGSGRPPRSTVISLQQQQLLKSHLDTILDVAFLERPVGMTVSVDRAGVIYVFQ